MEGSVQGLAIGPTLPPVRMQSKTLPPRFLAVRSFEGRCRRWVTGSWVCARSSLTSMGAEQKPGLRETFLMTGLRSGFSISQGPLHSLPEGVWGLRWEHGLGPKCESGVACPKPTGARIPSAPQRHSDKKVPLRQGHLSGWTQGSAGIVPGSSPRAVPNLDRKGGNGHPESCARPEACLSPSPIGSRSALGVAQ